MGQKEFVQNHIAHQGSGHQVYKVLLEYHQGDKIGGYKHILLGTSKDANSIKGG
jgi:hypothetical protein